MNEPISEAQRRAAVVVGVAYLVAMATSMFAEGYVRGSLIDYANAMTTAQNISASRGLFRVGIAAEVVTFAVDLALIAALYTILSPVNRHLAMFAAFTRVAAEAVCLSMAARSADVTRILSGAEYLKVFSPEQLAAMTRLSLVSHDSAYAVGFTIVGIGSTVFALLWLKSGYIPRGLAILGIVGSVMLGAGALAILVEPTLQARLYPLYMIPMFFFEVGIGFWLVIKGLRGPAVARRAGGQ